MRSAFDWLRGTDVKTEFSALTLALLFTSASLASLTLPACVANEPQAPTRGTIVSGPPPAPVNEASAQASPQATPPAPNAAWVTGYWHWTGAQYTWVPGHWETPPHGAQWMAPRYSSRDGQYFYEAGRWDRTAAQQPQAPPPAQGPANGPSGGGPNGSNGSSIGASKALR